MSLFAIRVSKIPFRTTVKKYFIRELVDFAGNCLMELWGNVKVESTDPETLRKFYCMNGTRLKNELIGKLYMRILSRNWWRTVVILNDKISHHHSIFAIQIWRV